ncbi:MAG: D-alanine--D-alanine ligase [Firmicutes bacterium]|nr:D-alanine--D-alanine ligase [Bacillota bacterium]
MEAPKKLKVAVIYGGEAEREVSIMSSKEILKSLDRRKYDCAPIEIPAGGGAAWVGELMAAAPDVVLLGLHGGIGEDGSLQGLLECLRIPYVGSKVQGSAIGLDKAMSKLIMRARHIPVADDVFIKKGEDFARFREEIARLGLPLVVKPNRFGSSIGVSIVRDPAELDAAAARVRALDDDILIEKYLRGQEVTCGVLETPEGLEVLTVLDIDADSGDAFYDYHAKYFNEMTKIEFSSQPDFVQTMIQEIAKDVFRALNCSGYGRVDMIVSEEQVYVLEINTLPGLTSHSLIPKAARGKGLDFPAFLDRLIEFEVNGRK